VREAIDAFRRGDARPDGSASGCNGCLPILLARAYDQAAMSDSAVAVYERYLAAPDVGRLTTGLDGLYLAGAHKRLGELYEAKGDRANALEHYRAFVTLWKDADPELQPKVADVTRRIARLARGAG
jgi:tetratricopeptide (TPR) repeat protein